VEGGRGWGGGGGGAGEELLTTGGGGAFGGTWRKSAWVDGNRQKVGRGRSRTTQLVSPGGGGGRGGGQPVGDSKGAIGKRKGEQEGWDEIRKAGGAVDLRRGVQSRVTLNSGEATMFAPGGDHKKKKG